MPAIKLIATPAERAEPFSKQRLLKEVDPELYELIKKEENRQSRGIELIASENFTSGAVLECLGACLTNKYSEGYLGARYYGGNEIIDEVESLCMKRCLDAFGLKSNDWGVNVQVYSGSPANFAVYTAFLKPHDRLMGMSHQAGGHFTHGFRSETETSSATSTFWESLPYGVDETGRLDFESISSLALLYRPKLLICGASSYSRLIDFKKYREIANSVGCLLMADMSHIAGLVAAGLHPSPFEFCDIVTSTTHKTLRGPRSSLIFVNKQRLGEEGMQKLNKAVFPGLQGGPHNNQIAAVACQMREVASAEWKLYAKQVLANAAAMANRLKDFNFKLITDGTENHLVLWDLTPQNIPGKMLEAVAEEVGISLNKNSVPTDVSAFDPSGVRIGSAAMTTRGCDEKDMIQITDFVIEALRIAKKIQEECGNDMKKFKQCIGMRDDVTALALKVEFFTRKLISPAEL